MSGYMVSSVFEAAASIWMSSLSRITVGGGGNRLGVRLMYLNSAARLLQLPPKKGVVPPELPHLLRHGRVLAGEQRQLRQHLVQPVVVLGAGRALALAASCCPERWPVDLFLRLRDAHLLPRLAWASINLAQLPSTWPRGHCRALPFSCSSCIPAHVLRALSKESSARPAPCRLRWQRCPR